MFLANDSATWDCIPQTFQQPFLFLNSGYMIGLDFLLVITLKMSGNVKALQYQFDSDLILVLQGLVVGDDYNL